MRSMFAALVFAACLCAPAARAQAGPVEGGHELQFWTGGGHGISGSQSGDGVWNVGLRFGWILTKPHGPGFLRGRLEYAVDAVPLFLVFQKTNTAYGVGVNPFAWRRPGPALPGEQTQRQRRGPLHAHFECRTHHSQSRHQQLSVPYWFRPVQPERIAMKIRT